MDEKISLEAISLYGDRYAEKVLNGFFSKKDKITGPEILTLCNVQQVNLFIIKELFRSWKDENLKIRSPYFDFDNEEVKEAMENLMNLLSKNISIGKTDFVPLLKKAVSQSLLAIFNPYDFFSMLITGNKNKLDIGSFREDIKYLKVNKAPLEKMLQRLEEKNLTTMNGNEAFAILDQILEEVNFTPEDIEQYVEKFSSVETLDPNRFFIAETKEVIPPPTPPVTPFEARPPEAPRVNKPKAISSVPNINEIHTREPRATLAENFQRIKSIRESLTINQKFMFTKVLFHGDFELFNRAVERLDQFDTLQAAIRYIEDEHASTWDRESEEFHEFMELVEKRFI